jgi:hypothetical protein
VVLLVLRANLQGERVDFARVPFVWFPLQLYPRAAIPGHRLVGRVGGEGTLMSEVRTSSGLGIMCPSCWKVVTAEDTGLPLKTAEDLRILLGWPTKKTLEWYGETVPVEWTCRDCGGEESE